MRYAVEIHTLDQLGSLCKHQMNFDGVERAKAAAQEYGLKGVFISSISERAFKFIPPHRINYLIVTPIKPLEELSCSLQSNSSHCSGPSD